MSRIIMNDISYLQCVPASKILTMWITLISKDLKAAQKLPETSSLAMLHSTGKLYFCMCSKFNVSNNAIPYVLTIHIQNCLKQEQLYKKRASLYSYFCMLNSCMSFFCSDPYLNLMGLHPHALKVFENVQDITGCLVVQGYHPDFTSLSYFKNLSRIRGKRT